MTCHGDDGYLGELSARIADASQGDGTGEVTWTYTVSDNDVDYLGEGKTVAQTYTVTVADDDGMSEKIESDFKDLLTVLEEVVTLTTPEDEQWKKWRCPICDAKVKRSLET